MVTLSIELDDDEYSEFLQKIRNKTPRDAILEAFGIKKVQANNKRRAEIAWRLMRKSRDEAERQYYELLQASLASEDGIADKQKVWLRSRDKETT